MKRVVVLISGRGSNLAALIADASSNAQNCAAGIAASEAYQVVGVISNKPAAGGLALAETAHIPTVVVNHQNYATRDEFDRALQSAVELFKPDLVVLAGFMRVLTADFVIYFAGRLVNIHPSLLPAFPGLRTHQRAIESGCKFAGCTVHFVTAELDHGPIIAQAAVPIFPADTADDVAKRVLVEEHRILPQAVRDFCAGRLVVAGLCVRVTTVP